MILLYSLPYHKLHSWYSLLKTTMKILFKKFVFIWSISYTKFQHQLLIVKISFQAPLRMCKVPSSSSTWFYSTMETKDGNHLLGCTRCTISVNLAVTRRKRILNRFLQLANSFHLDMARTGDKEECWNSQKFFAHSFCM